MLGIKTHMRKIRNEMNNLDTNSLKKHYFNLGYVASDKELKVDVNEETNLNISGPEKIEKLYIVGGKYPVEIKIDNIHTVEDLRVIGPWTYVVEAPNLKVDENLSISCFGAILNLGDIKTTNMKCYSPFYGGKHNIIAKKLDVEKMILEEGSYLIENEEPSKINEINGIGAYFDNSGGLNLGSVDTSLIVLENNCNNLNVDKIKTKYCEIRNPAGIIKEIETQQLVLKKEYNWEEIGKLKSVRCEECTIELDGFETGDDPFKYFENLEAEKKTLILKIDDIKPEEIKEEVMKEYGNLVDKLILKDDHYQLTLIDKIINEKIDDKTRKIKYPRHREHMFFGNLW